MRRHFKKVHAEYEGKLSSFFKRKNEELSAAQECMTSRCRTLNENAVLASYMVNYRVANAGEVHTIAENVIKTCVQDILNIKVDNKTASRSLCQIIRYHDVFMTWLKMLKTFCCLGWKSQNSRCKWTNQLAGSAILIVFVRYPYQESFEEDLLLCKPLPTTTTGAEIFK